MMRASEGPRPARATRTRRPGHAGEPAPAPGPGAGQEHPLTTVPPAPPPVRRARRFLASALVLALLWGGLTGWRWDGWVMGAPAVLLGAGLGLLLPAGPRWRLSPRGAVVFAVWFAIQSVRGAVDVSRRALSPSLPLRPGFRSHPLRLPPGPARVVFVNTITLLPGSLAAEIAGDRVIVHMLDTGADLAADLDRLERRVRALFALHPAAESSTRA